jgi:putative DNA primase/helicase
MSKSGNCDAPSRKGWTPATLDRLGVARERGRYVFTIHDHAGDVAGRVRYADDGSTPKMRADAGMSRDLWPRPEDVDGTYLVVGEPDAVTMAQLGLPVVALPGTGKWQSDWPARLAAGRDAVFFVADCDVVGRKRMEDAARKAASMTTAFVIDIAPDRDDGYDVGDAYMDLGPDTTRSYLDRLLAEARPYVDAPVVPTPVAGERVPVVIRANEVRIRPVRFLWRPWLPLGKVTILAGAPGQGKSQLTAYMAAATTRASFEPADVHTPGNAVILTAEDDAADTVVPRLLAAGADLSRVEFIVMRRTMPRGLTSDGLIKLPGDVDTLIDRLEAGDVRLVVFDPVASFVGRDHSTYVNQDVRDVLDPVVAVAAHYDVAVVLILHLNKSESKTWATKIGESHAFQAVARTVLALAPDPDDEDGEDGTDKILAPTKLNLMQRSRGLALKLRVVPATVYDDDRQPIDTSTIEITGTSSVSADDLLADQSERGARRDVLDFLVDTLAAGPVESKALKDAAKANHLSWRTVQRYYREVCKSAKPAEFHGPWVYALKDDLAPTSGAGIESALRDGDSLSALSTPTPQVGERVSNGSNPLGPTLLGEHGAHSGDELTEYRRRRDAMLGERWDDDDGA